MKTRKFCILLLVLISLIGPSCGKKMAPSVTIGKKNKDFEDAAFNYVFVEAIKQKLMGNGGEALKLLEQCIKVNPRSDASYYQMAQIVTANGDLNNGKKYAIKALSIDGENIWYLMMLGGMYYQEKNLDSAIIYYEKATKIYPENEKIQLTLGNLYSANKKYDEANSVFEALDKKYGVNESFTTAEIRNLMSESKYDEALTKTLALIKQFPNEINYSGILAEVYSEKGDKEKAIEVYNMLMVKNPDNAQVQLSLCDFLIKEKNYDELFKLLDQVILNKNVSREDIISLFSRIIELPDLIKDPDDRLTISLMVLEANYNEDDIIPLLRPDFLIKQDKLAEASVRLEEIINKRPENYYAWEKLLLVYLQMHDFKMLLERGEQCATRFNMSFLAKVLYANGALETGKYSLALDELKKAEIIAGDNKEFMVQILTMRADIYYRMKDYSKAFQLFEDALKYNKDDLTVLNNYAYYLAEQNSRLKEAEEMSQIVIEKEKGNTTYLDTYAWILYKRGKVNEAAKIMESIIKSGEKPDATWYEHYGYILKKQKKCPKAIENWEIAVKLDSTKINLINEIKNCAN